MKVFIVLTAVAALASAQFKCPNKDGQYEDERQCDKFYECVDGVSTTKLCPDGLVFDPTIRKINKCDQPFNVDCGDRTELLSGQDFDCPEKSGYYPDPYQCDLYYKCSRGKSETKLCPDGLVFSDENPSKEHCDIPSNVDCGERKELQEPKPSEGCPRQNGYFRHPDPQACDKFYYCSDGVPNEMPCPPGLYFDEETSNCDWKESVQRQCDKLTKDVLDDGFSCPDGEVMGPNGRTLPHPTFPHPEDCQKFYICRNGVQPQKGSCPSGKVYNEDTFMCDEPEKVTGCENYYEGQPLEKSKLPKKA